MVCLLTNQPEVQAQLDKYTSILGSEDAAYYVLSENNGYELDKAPNGQPSKLFSDLLSHYNGDEVQAIRAKAKLFTESFKNWFGDWINANNVTSSPKQDNDAIDYLFSINPQLEQIGTRGEYQQYINSIFPDSQVDSVYWHGTDSDFNQGLENATRGKGSGAPETRGEMYFNKQPWASLQYISGVNRNITDKNGFNNWVKLWWELKEILGNGRLQNDDWKNLVIGPDVRQEIPNKRGVFNRNQGGSNGKYLRERKADYGYENKSDKEFFEEVFGINYGKDTFQDWVDRNADKFKQIWNSRSVKKGIYPAILNVQNPIVEEGQNTYYEEQRGLMTRAKRDGNDAIISNKAKNEFGSDVIVMLNPQQDVHILGTNQDLEQFKQWKQHNNVSKVVDENGEPLYEALEIAVKDPIKSIDNQGTFSTQDNNIYNQQVEEQPEAERTINFYNIFDPEQSSGMTSREFIAGVRSYLPDNEQTNRLLDLFSRADIPVRIVESEQLPQGKSYMYYNTTTGEITVAIDEFNRCSIGYNAVSMLHELVHAFTANSIIAAKEGRGTELDNRVYSSLQRLLKQYQEVFNNETNENGDFSRYFYGLKDEFEFAAELLTNSNFYNLLIDSANQKNQNLYQRVLNAIKEFFDSIINLITGEQQDNVDQLRSDLLDLISYNTLNQVTTNEDQLQSSTRDNAKLLYNQTQTMHRYHFDTVEEMNKRLKSVRDKLATGLASRLKAIELDESTTYEQKEQIKYQLRNLNDSTLSDISVIMEFTKELAMDVPVIAREVLNAYKGNTNALTDDRLVSLSKNYFGFYCDYANTLYNNLSDLDNYKQEIGVDNYDTLMKQLSLCKNVLDTCFDHVKRMQAENAKRLLTNIGLSAKSNTILKYMEENSTDTKSDISILSRMFLSLDKMNDEVLRGLYKLVQDTENIIDNNTSIVARRLLDLAKKAGNRQKALYELDDDGKPTGFIVRDLKYGKMRKDYRNALKKIRKDLGIGEQDLGLPENRELRIEYNKRKDEWLSKHVERKYTDEYYSYFRELSQESSMARELIMDKIRSLKDKYRSEDGVVRYEKFSDEDYKRLQGYYLEKKSLASIYNVDGSIKEEGTVERRIADELTALNEKLAKGLKMKTNREKFEQIRKQKEKEYGADSKEYKKWFKRNTRVVISEEFYKLLDSINRETYPNTDYEQLNQEKRALLNMFRDAFTGEVNVKLMPAVTKNRLNRIDQQLRNIRNKYKANKSKTGLQFKDIAKIVATDNYNADRAEAIASDATSPGELQAFDMMNSVFDQYGMNHPRSYYAKVMPIDSKYISIEPSLEFAEMSEESPFINKNYDLKNPEYYQPKRSLYDNSKQYNKVMQDSSLKALRDEVINIMKQSNAKLNNLQGLSEYKLPQISGSMYRFLKARGFSGVGHKLADMMSVKNDDTGIQDKITTAPDGSSLAMVPQYFIKDLEDPATISADLVGSVIQYYRMAENFKQKSAIKGKVENIKAFLRQRKFTGTRGKLESLLRGVQDPKEGSETNVYKMAEKFINMNIYDVQTNNLTINVFNREINFTKLLQKLKNYGTLVNLGLNFSCAFTGFFTALHSHLSNIASGRFYTFFDALNAFKDMVWDLIRYGISAGNRNYKSQIMAQMDYFQVGSTLESMWKHSNRNRWINVLTEHWAFGAYSIGDYLIKGSILRSVMYNYRNVEGQFMYREEFLQKYGNTSTNRSKWRQYKSFAGSIKMIAGKPVAINPKDQQAVDKIKYTIGNTAKNVAASADGQLTSLQKAQFTTNVFGAMCMMHRQYIPILIQENFTMKRHWDYTSQREVEALFQTPLRIFAKLYKDKFTAKAFLRFFKDIFNSDDVVTRGNMRKLIFELTMILTIYPLITKATTEEADRDKKNKIKNMFAYIMLRTAFESRSKYTIDDIYSTIKSPTPLSTLLDNLGNVVNETISPITNIFSLTNTRERDKRITRGAYKYITPLERSLIKSTPFKNIIELNDLPSKRRYYETQIIK